MQGLLYTLIITHTLKNYYVTQWLLCTKLQNKICQSKLEIQTCNYNFHALKMNFSITNILSVTPRKDDRTWE